MRQVPIHIKLAVALATPLLALVGVLGLEVLHSHRDASAVRQEVAMAEAAVGPGGLFNSLQDERNRASVDLADLGSAIEMSVVDNAEAREATDESRAQFEARLSTRSPEIRELYAPGLAALDELDTLRQDVDDKEATLTDPQAKFRAADEVFARYTDLITVLLEANARVAVQISDPDLRRGAELSYLSSRQADVVARLIRHVLITGIGPGNLDERSEIQTLGELQQLAVVGERAIERIATGDYAAFTEKVRDAGVPFYEEIRRAVERGSIDLAAMLTVIDTGPDESYDGLPFRRSLKDVLDAAADDLVADAQRREVTLLVLALVSIVFAISAMYVVSRSITRPLRDLTRQAADMANRRLPQAVVEVLQRPLGEDVSVPEVPPVAVDSRDEVADVAAALNTVQTSALRLAVEQAVLRRNLADSFVNVGRRNQNLLSRQIDFITQLERDETDPDVLANLFRLDHLATRMRRNAESLLVLAGIPPARKWTAPVPLRDVIRAALGEVEDYQRVVLRAVEPATVVGSVAADLAHLLAEIVENALAFSPTDRAVELRGRRHPDNGSASYTLAVVDSGLGLPPHELERANRRLAGAESFTVAPSKYLGHYVAGNLAARHGIVVSLQSSASGRGVTATIRLPASLLTVPVTAPASAAAST